MAAAIRKAILDFQYAHAFDLPEPESARRAQTVSTQVRKYLQEKDQQTVLGFASGQADGDAFFNLLDQGKHPYSEEMFGELHGIFEFELVRSSDKIMAN